MAVRRLAPEDLDVIRDHYITGARQRRGSERKRAVIALIHLLEDESSHS